MSDDLPSQAEFWGVRMPELRVLLVITRWFNGNPFEIRGETRRIGTHHDLPLADLFLGTEWDYREHEHAHDRLLSNGLLREEYVCRRKIDWGPTQEGLKAIRECLDSHTDQVRPDWADENSDGPLYGDPNEQATHRKGVEIAGEMLPRMPVAYDITKPRHPCYGVEWYPTDGCGQSCHDLHVDTTERMSNVGVEVVTDSNNPDRLVDKWRRLQKEDRLTLWIFDRRETACKLWNTLDSRGEFHIDGQFRNPSNWSAKAINQKIWRSSNTYRLEPSGDLVHTVTGLLEGDQDTIYDLLESYH